MTNVDLFGYSMFFNKKPENATSLQLKEFVK